VFDLLRRAGLLALSAFVLVFALEGAVFVVATGVMVLQVLTGHGPEREQSAILAVLAFPLSLAGFFALALPGFLFVASTVRSVFRH